MAKIWALRVLYRLGDNDLLKHRAVPSALLSLRPRLLTFRKSAQAQSRSLPIPS